MATASIKKRLPVFVSSTYEDLIPYREAAQQVLIRLEQIVKGMEFFGSSSQKPLKFCLETVKECKIYVAILGMRYGSIDEETGKSFTQLEYEEAIKNNIPTLIYIIGNDCPVLSKYIDVDERGEKLKDFKMLLRANHMVSFFVSPEDFATKLTQDLVNVLDEMGHIEENTEIKLDIQREFEEVYKKFVFRPAKYQAQEGTLTIKISNWGKSSSQIKPNVISALGMIQGDAVSVPVYVIDSEQKQPIDSNVVYLYGEKEAGDWIEQVPAGTIATVKVRLSYVVTPEIERYDEGSIVKNVAYTNLILLEPPK